MWVADMDFATPSCIMEAVKKRAEHPILGYSIKPDSYFQSIIDWLSKRHQWEVKQNEISFSPGVVPGFTLAILAYSEAGDNIVVQPPVYFPFFIAVEKNNRQLLYNELIEKDNDYSIDFDDLEQKLSNPKTKILLTSNPHNPVGRVWRKEELQRMMDLCIKHNVLMLSDEIHSDLIFSGYKHIPTATLSPEAKKHTISFLAPSKTFNMAGLSTSFLVIQDKKLRQKYEEILEAYHLGLGNIFGNEALEAAYNQGAEWLEELIEYLQGNVDFVFDFLQTHIPEITFKKPEATYLLWLNCKSLYLDDDQLNDFFIHKAGIGMNKGSIFGKGGTGYMRMNIACPRKTLEKSLGQLKTAIDQLKDMR